MDRWLVLVDFDGTLTPVDGDFVVADELLGPQRQGAYRPLAEAYERLELGLAGYFAGYLELLGPLGNSEDIARASAAIRLRPGAQEVFEFCRSRGAEVRVASEGLDAYVRPALTAAGLADVAVSCNRLVVEDGHVQVRHALEAVPCDRCLSCKGSLVRRAREEGRRVVVVGDGASDLCGARLADRVLARGRLVEHCRRERIDCVSWRELEEVVETLGRWL